MVNRDLERWYYAIPDSRKGMQKLCYVRNNLFSVLHDVCTQNPAEAEEDMAGKEIIYLQL